MELIVIVLSIEEKELRKEQRRMDKWNKVHKLIDGIDHKECNICKNYFPANIEYFYPNKLNSIDWLYPYCIVCNVKKSDKWAKDNPDRRKELLKRINAKPEKKAMVKAAGISASKRGVRKEWWKKNPDKLKQYSVNHTNHKITEHEWESCLDYFNWSCAYCEYSYDDHIVEYGQQLHREHAIHDGNDYIDNCIPACRTCNTSKHDKDFTDWYNSDNPNFKKRRLNKIIKWVTKDWMNSTG